MTSSNNVNNSVVARGDRGEDASTADDDDGTGEVDRADSAWCTGLLGRGESGRGGGCSMR